MDSHDSPPGRQWTVSPEEADMRLDLFVAGRQTDLSRSAAARLIREGAVRVGGRQVKPGLALNAGDVVDYFPPPLAPAQSRPQALPLTILHQDSDLAVIVKPAGMVTHPAPGHAEQTLVNALLYHLDQLSGVGGEKRPGIVHRLDKDTSGLMLVAKNDRTHRALAAALEARAVRRWYDAVVWGQVRADEFTVESNLARDPRDRKRFVVTAGPGKAASTEVLVRRRFRDFCLLRLKLNTGRTHQIRVHCQYLGNPIVGDRTYGKSSGEAKALSRIGLPRPERQLLHAQRLEFTHPATGREYAFEAPWPEDFADFVSRLEK